MNSGRLRVLIVGSTSVIASYMREELSDSYQVTSAGRRDGDVYLDLGKEIPAIFRTLEFDVVINTAADFGGSDDDDIERANRVNAKGAELLCDLAALVKAKQLIMLSTISVYYEPGDAYFNAYGSSKLKGDEIARDLCAKRDVDLSILRLSQVYDAKSKCRKHQGLFYAMIDKAERGEDITIYGSNDAERNFIYVGDLIDTIRTMIEEVIVGTFDCVHPESVTLSEIAQTAFDVFGRGGSVVFDKSRPDLADIPTTVGVPIRREFKMPPMTTLKEGITMIKDVRDAL